MGQMYVPITSWKTTDLTNIYAKLTQLQRYS